MNTTYCRKYRAEAMVVPTATAWKVECSAKPAEHSAGLYTSRDKAVKAWEAMQRGKTD
jgi:hypothetical protein